MKKRIRFSIIGLAVALVAGLVVALMPAGVSVTDEGFLSLSSNVVLAVQQGTMGTGDPVPQQIESTMRRGGVPIVSVSYVDGIHIDISDPFLDIDFTQKQIEQWTKNKTIDEAEQIIVEKAQEFFEVWIKLTDIEDIDANDPLMQDPPILLDNERIEVKQNKDWLVITIAYFDIHLYNLNLGAGDFITRINSLDAGPVIGEWW